MRAVKQQGYGFKVHALVKTPTNLVLAFSEKGYGDLEPGNERYNFNQTASSPLPEHMCWEFQRGSLQVEKNYSGHITAAIGDIFEAALKWIAGATLLDTPGPVLHRVEMELIHSRSGKVGFIPQPRFRVAMLP